MPRVNLKLREQSRASASQAVNCNFPVKNPHRLPMKKAVLVAIVLATGCASTNTRTANSDPRITGFEHQRQTIAVREKQCIDEVMEHSRDETERIAAAAAPLELRIQREADERDRELSKCRARADNENAEISEQERNEYELQAQEEHSRASLMAILTTSRQH